MKRLIWIFLFSVNTSNGQNISKLKEDLQRYFKALPYKKDFHNWANEFKNNPLYHIDSNISETERIFFHIILKGSADYQPFNINADHVNFYITKFGLYNFLLKKTDSLTSIYVYLLYDSTVASKPLIVNEYKRLNKEFNRFFVKNKEHNTVQNKKIVEQTNNYMLGNFDDIPSLVINWHRDAISKKYFIGLNLVVTAE